jgi:hypothetical protein
VAEAAGGDGLRADPRPSRGDDESPMGGVDDDGGELDALTDSSPAKRNGQ